MRTVQVFQAVKANMLSMMKYSKIEFEEYKRTGDIVFLQQAGEKLFNALENYIQYVQITRYASYYEMHLNVKEKPLKKLLYDAKRLHQFFYNGELEISKDYAEEEYIRISALLETRIKRLK